jgi:CobQ-like glutamine amidotransferase family enzyme
MITLYTIAPARLNLNGDQANLLVIKRRLEWMGIECKLVAVESVDQLSAITPKLGDFLLVGHGSRAAMKSLEPWSAWRETVAQLIEKGIAGIAVGTGYEAMSPGFKRAARLSEYANIEASVGLPAINGYVNTDTDLPLIQKVGENFIFTMVHGPVLAKTPELADWFIERLGVKPVPNEKSVLVDEYAAGSNQH